MDILLLDNYDSFTYNLVHILRQIAYVRVDVIRNDKITLEEVKKYDKILLSPGPGIPQEAGIMMDIIKTYSPSKPILGVCLGHQGIAEAFGAKLLNLDKVMHGVATDTWLMVSDEVLFNNMPLNFKSGRYHSWVVDEQGFPSCLKVTARDENETIMAISHRTYDVKGVQFHPESILTEYGDRIIKNWVTL